MATRAPKASPTVEIGSTGLRRSSGYVNEEFLRELKGKRGAETLREMVGNDPIIGGIAHAIRSLLTNVSWRVEAASPAMEDVAAADFVSSCIEDMDEPWTDFIDEALSFLEFGWSYHETVYKRRGGDVVDPTRRSMFDDGKYGWRRLPIRAQDTLFRWEFSEAGDVLGMWQIAEPKFTPTMIPSTKAVHFRSRNYKSNPEGRSIFRSGYRPWYYKKMIEAIEAIGIERDLAGLPVMKVPADIMDPDAPAAKKAQYAELQRVVVNLRRDEQEGVILPSNVDEVTKAPLYELILLNGGSRRAIDTTKVIQQKNLEIAITVLADFILLGHEAVGSFALSSDKTALFAYSLGGWLRQMRDVMNTQLIPPLLTLNGIKGRCRLDHGDVEKMDLGVLGQFLKTLSETGMELFPDPVLDAWVRNVGGMPPRSEEALREVGEEDKGGDGSKGDDDDDDDGDARKPKPGDTIGDDDE